MEDTPAVQNIKKLFAMIAEEKTKQLPEGSVDK
jgi:hypothetical protein